MPRVSLGHDPFPPLPPTASLSALFDGFAILGSVRLPTFVHHAVYVLRPSRHGLLSQTTVGSPSSHSECFRTCSGPRHRYGILLSIDVRCSRYCLPLIATTSASRFWAISWLNTRLHVPLSTSHLHPTKACNGLRPVWSAIPSGCRTSFIPVILTVNTGYSADHSI